MTKAQAIKKSIEHWERMIAWVKKQPQTDKPYYFAIEGAIGEDWSDEHCPLCEFYLSVCNKCPLQKKHGHCSGYEKDRYNNWNKVFNARTWKTWLKHAKVLLKQLKSL